MTQSQRVISLCYILSNVDFESSVNFFSIWTEFSNVKTLWRCYDVVTSPNCIYWRKCAYIDVLSHWDNKGQIASAIVNRMNMIIVYWQAVDIL